MQVEHVRVEFDPPRQFRKAKRSYWLEDQGEDQLQLPIRETTLEFEDTPDGPLVRAVTIPRWIAEDRGLVESSSYSQETKRHDDEMGKRDWFLLGCTMALVVQGYSTRDAVFEAVKLADRLIQESD